MSRAEAAETAGARDVPARTARLALIAIVALAFLLRLVYVLQSRASPFFDAPEMDALYHVEWARAFAAGEEFQPGPFFRAPLYPWFLGILLRLCGDGLLAPRLAQAAIGAGSCALVYAVAARAFDRRTGLLAAVLAASYWMLIYFDGELLLPVLEVPTTLLAILGALSFGARPTKGRAAATGAALGIAALVRPNVLLFGLCVAIWMLARRGEAWRARLAHALVLALATLAPILPISAYNAFAGGDRVLISSQGGVNLWIGNNPTADGSTAIAPGTRPDWWGGFHDTVRQAEAAEGRELLPSEVSRHYTVRALRWMRSEPLAALRLLLWKLRLFWTDWELGNNQDEVFFALRFGPILRWLPLGFGLVAPLGLIGIALTLRRWRELGPLILFVPAWCASVVAFFVCARFRMPLIPVLLVLAAAALVFALDAFRDRRWRQLAAWGSALALLAFLVQQVPRAVDRTPSKGLWQLGVHAAQDGRFDEAVELYRESVAANPRFAIARQDLGLALRELGDGAGAEASLRAALELSPGLAAARLGLVEVLLQRGDLESALAEAREVVARAPLLSRGRYTLARSLLARAEAAQASVPEEVHVEFQRAFELADAPDDAFDAAFALGELARSEGRDEVALRRYEEAVRARPEPDSAGWFWRCQAARTGVLVRAGRAAEALELARALAREHADDPRAQALLRGASGRQ